MGGPQLTLRKSTAVQPFVRALIGGGRINITNGPNDTNLAFGGGGGVDFRLTPRLYLRVNADFVRTAFFSSVQKGVQTGAGLDYRFGDLRR